MQVRASCIGCKAVYCYSYGILSGPLVRNYALKTPSGALTLSFRQATQAVILRDISGIFLSPNDSRNAIAADTGVMLGKAQ